MVMLVYASIVSVFSITTMSFITTVVIDRTETKVKSRPVCTQNVLSLPWITCICDHKCEDAYFFDQGTSFRRKTEG